MLGYFADKEYCWKKIWDIVQMLLVQSYWIYFFIIKSQTQFGESLNKRNGVYPH